MDDNLVDLELYNNLVDLEHAPREGFLFDRDESTLQENLRLEGNDFEKARSHRIRTHSDSGAYGAADGLRMKNEEEAQSLKMADDCSEKRALSEGNDSDYSGKRRKYGELLTEIESAEGDDTSLGAPARKAQREKKRRDKLNSCFSTLSQLCAQDGQGPATDKLRIVNEAIRLITSMREAYDALCKENTRLKESVCELQQDKKELRDEKKFLKAQLESYMHCHKLEGDIGERSSDKRQPHQDGSPFFLSHEIDTSRDAQLRPPVA